MSSPRYTVRESAARTSADARRATASATTVLPTAVGPAMTTSGGLTAIRYPPRGGSPGGCPRPHAPHRYGGAAPLLRRRRRRRRTALVRGAPGVEHQQRAPHRPGRVL